VVRDHARSIEEVRMRAGVLGTGMVGRAIATKLAELGHEWIGTHPDVTLVPFADAITGADIVARGLESYLLLWIGGMQAFGSPMFNVKVVVA
jgi:hypothetical protein